MRKRYLPLAISVLIASSDAALAQKVVFAEDFNGYREGPFVPPGSEDAEPYGILHFDALGSEATIVPGDRTSRTTRHLVLKAELKNPGFNIAGHGWKPDRQPRVRERNGVEEGKRRISRREQAAKDPAGYTLRFEIALLEGPGFREGGLALDVILLGDTTGSGIRLNPDVSKLKAGAGFIQVSAPLKEGNEHLETATFDPTDSSFRIEFNTVGGVSESVTQRIALDNIELVRNK